MVDGRPLLSFTIKNLSEIKEIDRIYVVTNDKFNENFLKWKQEEDDRIEIVNDGTKTNEERLGGVMDFALALEKCDDDILVVLGDNYFNFPLKRFVEYFQENKRICVALHDLKDMEKAKRFGVLQTERNRIVGFEEKPENPKSTLISTGCYLFPKKELENIWEYIKSNKNKEGIGYMIKDFIEQGRELNGFVFEEDWHDIGTIEDYEKIKKDIEEIENH